MRYVAHKSVTSKTVGLSPVYNAECAGICFRISNQSWKLGNAVLSACFLHEEAVISEVCQSELAILIAGAGYKREAAPSHSLPHSLTFSSCFQRSSKPTFSLLQQPPSASSLQPSNQIGFQPQSRSDQPDRSSLHCCLSGGSYRGGVQDFGWEGHGPCAYDFYRSSVPG